jgi:transcriptional regulator with XRE-family HTH domain
MIGEGCRAARRKLRLTQELVSERVGLVTEVYGRMERGNMMPSVPTLVKVSRVLGMSPSVLLGFGEPRHAALTPLPVPEWVERPGMWRLINTARRLSRRNLHLMVLMCRALLEAQHERERPAKARGDA